MKILSGWLRPYLPTLPVDDIELANALTLRGIAVEGNSSIYVDGHDGDPNERVHNSLFEMDITTNRVDAMNHYGIAREASIIYGLELKSPHTDFKELQSFPRRSGPAFPVHIE